MIFLQMKLFCNSFLLEKVATFIWITLYVLTWGKKCLRSWGMNFIQVMSQKNCTNLQKWSIFAFSPEGLTANFSLWPKQLIEKWLSLVTIKCIEILLFFEESDLPCLLQNKKSNTYCQRMLNTISILPNINSPTPNFEWNNMYELELKKSD